MSKMIDVANELKVLFPKDKFGTRSHFAMALVAEENGDYAKAEEELNKAVKAEAS